MLPEGWQRRPLKDIFVLNYGKAFDKANLTPGGSNPVYGTGGIIGKTDTYLATGESIIVGRKGTIDKPTFVPAGQRFWTIDTTYYLETHEDMRFVFYLLNSIDLAGLSEATSMPSLNRNTLYSVETPLPPLPEQKRIAEVLGSVDAAIEATKAVIDQTKTVKQGLLQTLLTRGIGHTKFKDSPLGEIPESWEVKTLGDILKLEYGKALSKASYAADGVCDVYGTAGIIAKTNDKLGNGSSVIVGRKGSITSVHFVPEGKAFWAIDTTYYVVSEQYMPFIFMFFSNLDLSKYNESTGVPSLNRNTLYGIEIALPPRNEQEKLSEIIDKISITIQTQTTKLAALHTLKKGLMDDLLTGKVRVGVSAQKQSSNVVPFSLTAPVDAVRKHAVLAAEITAQLHHLPTFGATKREKLTDLVVRHVGLDETTDRQAARHAAGSYDPKARREIDDIFERENWFRIQRDTAVRFTKGSAFGGHKAEFEEQFSVVKQPIQKVINLLRDYDTRHCEIVDTLYVAWNDFLIEGKSPTDDEIITDVLTNWHDSKRQIPHQDWRDGLAWMRARDFMPSGRGRSTKQKTLL